MVVTSSYVCSRSLDVWRPVCGSQLKQGQNPSLARVAYHSNDVLFFTSVVFRCYFLAGNRYIYIYDCWMCLFPRALIQMESVKQLSVARQAQRLQQHLLHYAGRAEAPGNQLSAGAIITKCTKYLQPKA